MAAPPSWAQSIKSPSQLDFLRRLPVRRLQLVGSHLCSHSQVQVVNEKEGSKLNQRKGAFGSDFQLVTACGGSGKVADNPQRSTSKVHSFLFHPGLKRINFAKNSSKKKKNRSTEN